MLCGHFNVSPGRTSRSPNVSGSSTRRIYINKYLAAARLAIRPHVKDTLIPFAIQQSNGEKKTWRNELSRVE